MNIVIIGAGVMGSALTVPLSHNGHDVNLWGTELDGDIVASIRANGRHPRLDAQIPHEVRTYTVDQLPEAVNGRELVLMAITSDALGKIFRRVAPFLRSGQMVVSVSKGFDYDERGRVILLPEVLTAIMPPEIRAGIPLVCVGGPSKAVEVAHRVPTAVVYAGESLETARLCRKIFGTPFYMVEPSSDLTGLEACAALKNAYAIALGLCEGLGRASGIPHNNTKSALFTYATCEMADIALALGGRGETAFGLAGSGDLEVTGEAGRNRILGELIGQGLDANTAVGQMRAKGQTVEGYPAAKLGYELCDRLSAEGLLARERFALLEATYSILYRGAPPHEVLQVFLNRRVSA